MYIGGDENSQRWIKDFKQQLVAVPEKLENIDGAYVMCEHPYTHKHTHGPIHTTFICDHVCTCAYTQLCVCVCCAVLIYVYSCVRNYDIIPLLLSNTIFSTDDP